MRRGARTLIAVLLLALALPVAAFGAVRGQAEAPRIELSVPAEAGEGTAMTARLRASAAPAGSRAVVEVAASSRWLLAGAAAVRARRFAISFRLPAGVGTARVRALLMSGRRRLAVSPVRLVRVRAATTASHPQPPPAAAPQPSEAATVEPPPAPQAYEGPMYWGAWIDGAPWDWSKVTDFEAEVHKPLSLLEFSSPFVECSSGTCEEEGFPATPFEAIRQDGAIPFFSWGSQSNPTSVEPSAFQLSDLIDGSHDRYIEEWAAAAAAWGHPFFLRFDWEMNGNWFPWGEGTNGNQPGEYVAAWRHVHDIFVREGATNVSWVWCPYVNPNGSKNIAADLASLYPGGEYVDWTCLDGYNWGTHPELQQQWRSFSYLFAPTYAEVATTIAPDKPMLIGETASSEEGGSKGQWIEEMFAALPDGFPAVRGLIWFDVPDQGHDWPLSTSVAAEAAFAAGVAGARWLGSAFAGLATSPIPPPG